MLIPRSSAFGSLHRPSFSHAWLHPWIISPLYHCRHSASLPEMQ